MAIQDDNTILMKSDLKAYHEAIAPMLGGSFMMSTNVSDYYSTDEKIVGIWTDGRPVYQKTFTFTTPSSLNTDTTIVTVPKVSNLVNILGGFITRADGGLMLLNSNYPSQSNSIFSVINSSNNLSILLRVTINVDAGRSGYITIQYTKTTDEANSAVSTPGCYDINRPDLWPANKEIFFGNGLYGFRGTGTYNVTANTPTSKTITTIITNAKSTTKIFNYGGTLKKGSGASSSDTILGLGYGANVWTSLLLDNTGLVMYNYDTTARSNIPYDIWVTYTK